MRLQSATQTCQVASAKLLLARVTVPTAQRMQALSTSTNSWVSRQNGSLALNFVPNVIQRAPSHTAEVAVSTSGGQTYGTDGRIKSACMPHSQHSKPSIPTLRKKVI